MAFIGRPNGENIKNRVRFMKVGEGGYIRSSAIQFDTEKRPYLDLTAIVSKANDGDKKKLHIKRTGPGESDYDVSTVGKGNSWVVEENHFSSDYSPEDDWKNDFVRLAYEERGSSKKKGTKKSRPRLSPIQKLERDIGFAVRTEEYELAARLRDRLKKLIRY